MSEDPKPHDTASVPVEVTIGGRSYRLRGTNPEKLRTLAGDVDATLRQTAGPEGPQESYKVAVLAALNLAAEHDEIRQEWRERLAEFRERAKALDLRLQEVAKGLQEKRPPRR